MTHLPEALFLNPVWHALQGPHRQLAVRAGLACRYPADVSPFAAVEHPTDEAFQNLRTLLAPAESLWIADCGRLTRGLRVIDALECVQMVWPTEKEVRNLDAEVTPLGAANAAEMVALTDIAFPGFFRPHAHRMGSYIGVRLNGELIAMGGERLRLPGHPELSGICTHPAHRGKGLAGLIVLRLLESHRRLGLTSWLHVGSGNTVALDLYDSLGFERIRSITLQRIERV